MITQPYLTNAMKAKNFIVILVIIFLSSYMSSCINQSDNTKHTNTDTITNSGIEYTNATIIKTDSVLPEINVLCQGDNIIEIIPNKTTGKQKIRIMADTICMDSFVIRGGNKSVNIDNMMRNLVLKASVKNDFTLPCMIAICNNSVPINICTENKSFTNIKYEYKPIQSKNSSLNVELISGDASPLVYKRKQLVDIDIVNIKKWLFLNDIHLQDSLINKIYDITKELCTHTEYEYTTLREIPIFKSVKNKKYYIKTNTVADYYYLYAAEDTTEVKNFVAEQVALDFKNANKDINDYFVCNCVKLLKYNLFSNTNVRNHLLNLYLIGINKDWTYWHTPFARIKIDNIGPSIAKKEARRQTAILTPIATSNSKYDVSYRLQEELERADVLVEFCYPTLIFDFIKDVKKVEIEIQGIKKVVDLSKEESPYYYTCHLPLILGENKISITAYDCYGNDSWPLIHTINTMVKYDN